MKHYLLVLLAVTMPSLAAALDTTQGEVNLTLIADGLDEPWAVDVLPDGGVVITERDGQMLHITPDGERINLAGVPRVVARGQGGLLDVTLARDFAKTRELFLTYSGPQPRRGSGTSVATARLSDDGTQLEDLKVIFQQAAGFKAPKHFGSRVVEANDGTLFATIGERGDRPSAQDLRNHNGSVVRIARSGGVPGDNPFVDTPDAAPEIWSYGHRNPQGAALDLDGNLWVVEHGAKGGDEINKIIPGANYGWPVISYGVHYSGRKIGQGSAAPGMEQPAFYWDPSIAPSGMMIYSGKLWPEWRGDMFIGSLKFDYISRVDDASLREVEQIKSRETGRVRDIVEGPDGAIWFLSVERGALYKMTP